MMMVVNVFFTFLLIAICIVLIVACYVGVSFLLMLLEDIKEENRKKQNRKKQNRKGGKK